MWPDGLSVLLSVSHEPTPESGTRDGSKDPHGDCNFDFFNIRYAPDTLGDAPSCYATRQENLNILLENSSSGESCLSQGKCHGEVRHCERMWPYAKTSEEDGAA